MTNDILVFDSGHLQISNKMECSYQGVSAALIDPKSLIGKFHVLPIMTREDHYKYQVKGFPNLMSLCVGKIEIMHMTNWGC